ncbi:MAG: hypothetical protein ACYTKD_17455 [Planctomycetota bacterium]|jgi:hypothetical protein
MKKAGPQKQAEQAHSYAEYVYCRVCGKPLKSVGWVHLRLHGLSTAEYKKRFGVDYVLSDGVRARISKTARCQERDSYEPRSREGILRAVQELGRLVPRLTSCQLMKRAPNLARQAFRLFGSWPAVCEVAGLDPPRQQSWSRERIIAAVRERASAGLAVNAIAVRRATPTLYGAALLYFRGWQEVVEAAGLDYSKVRKFKPHTRETIAGDLRAWVLKHGTLSPKALAKSNDTLYTVTRLNYGSVDAAAHALGLPFRRLNRQWSRDLIVKGIRHRDAEGGSLRGADVVKEDNLLHQASRRHFGSWGAAVEASGFDYSKIRGMKLRTRETISRDLRAWMRDNGPLCRSVLRATDNPLHLATCRTFGSLEKAAEELGLPFYRKNQRWSRNRVIKEITRRAAEGRALRLTAVRDEDIRLYSAARNHFGSWASAVAASGLDYARIRKRAPTLAKN